MITSPKAGAAIYSPVGFDAARVLLAAGPIRTLPFSIGMPTAHFWVPAESARRSNGLHPPVRMNSPLRMILDARARCG